MAKKASRKAAKPVMRKQSAKRPAASRKASKPTPKPGKTKMASFKYVGDPNDKFSGPDTATYGGVTFKKGDVVNVPDEEKGNVERLRKHSHFVDMSDKDQKSDADARQKAIDEAEKSRVKAEEEQRKRDEADRKKMEANRDRASSDAGSGGLLGDTPPRPPGTVTRESMQDAFGGRTVEERTQAEDHTKAGKTKGGGTVVTP